MNPRERHQAMVRYLDAVGACSYPELAERFGVSEMTVRRDVDRLVSGGGLIKTLGGVQTAHAPKHLYESPVQQRLGIERLAKECIAEEAAKRIQPQQTVFLDGGTTCLYLARCLAGQRRGVTVVTHSALVCLELGQSADGTIVSLGGQFDPASACFVGPAAEETARRLFFDVAFLSTKGFLPEEGTFESAMATFRIKQIVAEQAARVCLLVDHSKFGRRALCKVLDVEQIDEVITSAEAPSEGLAALRRRDVEVCVASDTEAPLAASPPEM